MIGRIWKKFACLILVCGIAAAPVGCQTLPVIVIPSQAAIDLSGTYMITVTSGGSQDDLGSDPTLIISNGLLTRLGTITLTPTSATADNNRFVWNSNGSVSYLFTNYQVTVTLDVNLQPDNTLIGTLAASGQSVSFNVILTKQ